eukprot:CAMPEP_0115493026 /NCGR_PEP_ID=MMETSP0271-20121206/63958_1 /TAXON_ID=71861 /ORGANISM="Scrippsiella trochoidea, Strain CCMP3099" /LENGTH=93 /DNA_ID=CAMNT_0002921493 /DNA_START=73 /DNA_END=355 /DNA_ORIENTATION=-
MSAKTHHQAGAEEKHPYVDTCSAGLKWRHMFSKRAVVSAGGALQGASLTSMGATSRASLDSAGGRVFHQGAASLSSLVARLMDTAAGLATSLV